jgi:hypothetical protein
MKIMEKSQRTCLDTLKNLEQQINTLAEKNLIRNQIAVLNGLSKVSDCLSAFQDSLTFRNTLELGKVADLVKWEEWEADLGHAFDEATSDETKMSVHMAVLSEIVDSKIDVDATSKTDLKPAGKSK